MTPSCVHYDHAANYHTLASPRTVIPILFERSTPQSLLDVGCGIGTWLAVAREFGINDVLGMDGVDIPPADLLVPAEMVRLIDLSLAWDLNRTFEVALCLEVAEHLDESAGALLIERLTRHSDEIVFSAACPQQPGQHHVNCQWPDYWQRLFNMNGFSCSDQIRWRIWDDRAVDVWYRQNMFIARRDEMHAGNENRLRAVIHPEFSDHLVFTAVSQAVVEKMTDLENGTMPVRWYASSALKAVSAKLRRRLAHV